MLTFKTRDLDYKAKTNPIKGKIKIKIQLKKYQGMKLKGKKTIKKIQKKNRDQIQHKNKLKLNVDE